MKMYKKCLSIFLTIITTLTSLSAATPVFAEGSLLTNESISDEVPAQEEMTSKIVREVTEFREEYAKHFVCEDGSYIVATYSDPVHYKDGEQWKEIDNSLKLSDVKSSSGKAMYTPKAGIIDVKIPQNFENGQKVFTTNKGYTISFGANHDKIIYKDKPTAVVKEASALSSSKMTNNAVDDKKSVSTTETFSNESEITAFNNKAMSVENKTGAIVYEDVFGKDDLEYIVTTNSIKENIVVNEKQNKYIYSFDMDFGELVPVVNEDNSIRLVEPKNAEETVFYIEAPYMYDANGIKSEDIDMSLVEKDGIYVMTLHANAEWINSAERAFPVIIDPTVYLSFDDVFVMDGIPNKNTTKINNELRVGRNLANITRTYIKPTLPSNIPAGSYINNAYLTLTKDSYYQLPLENNISVRAYDCYDVKSWNPTGITWENQPYSKSNNGYSSGHTCLSSVAATSSKTTYTFSITDAVKRWLNGGVNNGIMLASSDESSKTQIDFHSSRASSSSNYPQMYITYTVPSLSISNWEADSQSNEKTFKITTGNDWTAYTNADWISLSAMSGTPGNGYSTNKIIVSENTSVINRTGTVTVKSGNTIIGTITVTQYGAEPYLALNTTNLSFEAGNNKQILNIESNTVWSFGELPDWITVTPSTGSKNSTVEVEVAENYGTVARESTVMVTADTVTKTVNISQTYDNLPPAAPNLYEEGGLVYISAHSADFDSSKDSPEHVEYKLGTGEWTDYEGEPLSIIRSYDATIYARTCDVAGNVSEVSSLVLECELGEYTTSYTDIAFGEGVLPIGFERTYSSEDGWFFTFQANIAEYTNGYVFTDFYGNKQYYIVNNEGKYVSACGEELKVEEGTLLETNYSYIVPYGELDCYFNEEGKLAIVKDNYNAATYSWANNNLYITDEASNTNIVRLSGGKPIYISASRFDTETNTTLSKNVQYQWTDGNLTKFIDAANVEHNYVYTNGLLKSNEDEIITYSVDGRVKKITQANGAFVKYTYNDTAASADTETPGNIGAVTVSDSKGVTDVLYYADGFAISNGLYSYSDDATYAPNNISGGITSDTLSQVAYVITVPVDESEEVTYEEYPLYEEDADGNFTFYAYDSENNVTATLFVKAGTLTVTETTTFEQAAAVAEQKSEYCYDTNDNVISEVCQKRIDGTLVNLKKTVYTYNDKESIVTQKDYQWIDNTWYQTYGEAYTYNGYGNITSKVSTVYTNTKNADTGMVEVSSNATAVTFEYDAWCQQIRVTTNAGKEDETVSETVYDVFGRTHSVTTDGKTIAYTYDGRGNVLTATEADKVTIYTYDCNGNLLARTNPNGAVAEYIYDTYGNLTSHTFNGYVFTYNTLGSILTASSENGQIVNYIYSPTVEQQVLASNFGNGQSVVYTYNEDGEITAIKLGEETKYGYEYFETTDENGDATKEWIELNDYVNNLKKVIENNKITVKNFNGNVVYSVETVTKNEDDPNSFDGRIVNDKYISKYEDNIDKFYVNTNSWVAEKSFQYDEQGRLCQTDSRFIKTKYGYLNDSNLVTTLSNSGGDIRSENYSYSYDEDGRIQSVVSTNDYWLGADHITYNDERIDYSYDVKGQLISSESSTTKNLYSYDNRGNIVSKKEYTVTLDENNEKVYTENTSNSYIYDETWKDKLIGFDGQTITYDASGNPINYLGHNLSWTMGRQLASFDDINYTYDENGMRVSKTVNGKTTKYYYDGTLLMMQEIGGNQINFMYDRNDEVVGFYYCGQTYSYVKNLQGDITGIISDEGFLAARYVYDDWGNCISVESGYSVNDIANLNPFRYRGYYYDSDTELYYLQSRYYDPKVGRFINCDDVNYLGTTESELSYNAFTYCTNNPVTGSDADGCFNIFDLIKIITKLVKINTQITWLSNLVSASLKIKKETRSYLNRKINGKYIITVNFSGDNVKKFWTKLWELNNCKDMVDIITDLILEQFKKQTNRDFLLSKKCVSDEIYLHLKGYMWSIGKGRFCPVKFSGYYMLKKNSIATSKEEFIKEATKDADIYEVDMFFNTSEAAWYGFDYYNGIAECYKNTKKDPYYNIMTGRRKSSYVREGWLYEKL